MTGAVGGATLEGVAGTGAMAGQVGAVVGCLLPRPVGAPQLQDSGAALLPVTIVCMQMRMHVDVCKCVVCGVL